MATDLGVTEPLQIEGSCSFLSQIKMLRRINPTIGFMFLSLEMERLHVRNCTRCNLG